MHNLRRQKHCMGSTKPNTSIVFLPKKSNDAKSQTTRRNHRCRTYMLLLSRHFQIFNRHIQNKQLSIIRVRISISANNTKNTHCLTDYNGLSILFYLRKRRKKKYVQNSQTRHLWWEFIVATKCDRKSACNGIYRKSAHSFAIRW